MESSGKPNTFLDLSWIWYGVDYPPNLKKFGKWAMGFLLGLPCHIPLQFHGLQPFSAGHSNPKIPQDLQTLFRQVSGSVVGVLHFQTRANGMFIRAMYLIYTMYVCSGIIHIVISFICVHVDHNHLLAGMHMAGEVLFHYVTATKARKWRLE